MLDTQNLNLKLVKRFNEFYFLGYLYKNNNGKIESFDKIQEVLINLSQVYFVNNNYCCDADISIFYEIVVFLCICPVNSDILLTKASTTCPMEMSLSHVNLKLFSLNATQLQISIFIRLIFPAVFSTWFPTLIFSKKFFISDLKVKKMSFR